jgi:hypothetical protein
MWYYINEDKSIGPINLEELLKVIDKNTLVWNDEGDDSVWRKAELIPIIQSNLLENNNQTHIKKFNHFKYIIILFCFFVGYFFLSEIFFYYYVGYVFQKLPDCSLLYWLIYEINTDFLGSMFFGNLFTLFESISNNNPDNIPLYLIQVIKLIGTLFILYIWFRNFKKYKIKN